MSITELTPETRISVLRDLLRRLAIVETSIARTEAATGEVSEDSVEERDDLEFEIGELLQEIKRDLYPKYEVW